MSAPFASHARRLAESPTLSTWLSLGARSVDLLLILPLVLRYLPAADAAVWMLVLAIPRLFQVAEYGFGATFVRLLAYAKGQHSQDDGSKRPSLAASWQAMRWTYRRLSIWAGVGAALFGTLALVRPISGSTQPGAAWLAWALIAVTNPLLLHGLVYANFLTGVERVALVRRWDALGVLIGSGAVLLVLWSGAGLAALVAARQAGQLIVIALYRWLFRRSEEGRRASVAVPDTAWREVLSTAWPPAWRSFLGGLMSVGLVELSGILYAQFGTAVATASYLLAIRLIQAVMQFANAPFYSRLPLFARLYSEGRTSELLRQTALGMRRALWAFVAGFTGLGLLGPALLAHFGSQTPFPATRLWILLGVAFFLERVGAMHLQLFSTTNDIRWHIANGVYGGLFLVSAALLAGHLGVYTFPVAWLIGSLGFYIWYCARLSYREFQLRFWEFERRSSVLPFLALFLFALVRWNVAH